MSREIGCALGRVGHTDMGLIAAARDQGPPDITLSPSVREFLKERVHAAEARLSSHELMYLAGAFEVAANRKRVEEEGEKGR